MHSTTIDVDGPVHLYDWGGVGSVMFLVHGLGASHHSWTEFAPLLTTTNHVVGIDLIGHGRTPLRGRPTMDAQTRLVEQTVERLGLAPCLLIGNSMGGLVSAMVAERSPEIVSGLVLIDPALPLASLSKLHPAAIRNIGVPLIPGLGRAAVRQYERVTSPAEQLDRLLELTTFEPGRVSDGYRKAAVSMIEARRSMPWATDAFIGSARSLTTRLARRRSFDRMIRRITVPTLLLHGAEDRLVSPASARHVEKIRPDWDVRILEEVGHVPQVEIPHQTAAMVQAWSTTIT